jgi:hypothetical protein
MNGATFLPRGPLFISAIALAACLSCGDGDDAHSERSGATSPGAAAPGVGEPLVDPFVPVYTARDVTAAVMPESMKAVGEPSLRLAVHKGLLGERFFLTGYVKQLFVSAQQPATGAARTTGTRVVTLREGPGVVFVVDVDSRKKANDIFDPEILVEAWPIVRDEVFERRKGAENYLLLDVAAGRSRFGIESDDIAFSRLKVDVDLALAQRFRSLPDGVAFEKIFTGSVPAPGDEEVRISGTVVVSLRRYAESEGFEPKKALPGPAYFFLAGWRQVPNTGMPEQLVARWHLPEGRRVKWLVVDSSPTVKKDARLAGYDIYEAIKTGIESWNDAFGRVVFEVERAAPTDAVGDDDKNLFILSPNPLQSNAFADIRVNPNTGEIRGASVHFSSGVIDLAHALFAEGKAVDRTVASTGERGASLLSWEGFESASLCDYDLSAVADGGMSPTAPAASPKEQVERFIASIAAHEVGHTLGLRHNFKGSLSSPASSLMDYLPGLQAAEASRPGRYDVEAIRFLYGMSMEAPKQPFCNDASLSIDPKCARFDASHDPLRNFYSYAAALDRYFADGSGSELVRANQALMAILDYLRSGESGAVRADAWTAAVAPLRAPFAKERLVASPLVGVRVDEAARQVFSALYPEPPPNRPSTSPSGSFVTKTIPLDVKLAAEMAAELRANVLNVDGIRSYPTRRMAVDVLHKMQVIDGYKALRDSRDALTAVRAMATGDEGAYLDDLLTRIEKAISPYFIR